MIFCCRWKWLRRQWSNSLESTLSCSPCQICLTPASHSWAVQWTHSQFLPCQCSQIPAIYISTTQWPLVPSLVWVRHRDWTAASMMVLIAIHSHQQLGIYRMWERQTMWLRFHPCRTFPGPCPSYSWSSASPRSINNGIGKERKKRGNKWCA